jgi:hypothetical protein
MKTQTPETTNERTARILARAAELWEVAGETYTGEIFTAGESNAKLRKTETENIHVIGISLYPGKLPLPGQRQNLVTCPHASAGCLKACLGFSGLAAAFPDRILVPRILKTWFFATQREAFLERAMFEARGYASRAKAQGAKLYCRPNVISNILWHLEAGGYLVQRLWEEFRVKSYGYTKRPGELTPGHPHDTTGMREHYRLVFSRSETNETECSRILQSGGDISVVFHENGAFAGRNSALQRLPETYTINGVKCRVIDGDAHDLRGFGDPVNRAKTGRIIGLRLKGNNAEREAAIQSGFSLPARTF